MTKDEAILYLPVNDEDDLQDSYEEKLFELKQFFLSRFPMSKLIIARMSKFEKVEEAFIVLGGEVSSASNIPVVTLPELGSIHTVYIWYNREKNALRLLLSAAQSYSEVLAVLNEYLRIAMHYAKHWQIGVNEEEGKSIKIGVEPNPMDIQEALNELSEKETIDSQHILTLPDENVLKSEAKRLSLWLNFESNEQSIR
ncbi:MAG: hypothetical protein P8P74_10550 [Crocinitomicaceae bacterium]|nr:hypothetical protein [Crocinitomicaceae bacterium]